VDVYGNGKRTRKFFKSRSLAEAFESQVKFESGRKKLGIPDLTPQQYAIAAEVFRMLPSSANLLELAQKWTAEHRTRAMPLELGVEAFLEDLKRRNKRPAYHETMRKVLNKFQRFFGPEGGLKQLSEITRDDIGDFLSQGIKDTPINRSNHIRDLSVFFGWAKDEGYVAENIPGAFKKPTVDRKTPAVLTPQQAKDMLKNSKNGDRAYAALGLFAGIRPEEITRLDWKNVDLEHSKVIVPAEVSKTRMQRTVELEPNAVAWLRTVAKPKGPIWNGGKKWLIERLLKAAKMEQWVQDVLRHTFVTYHTIAFENPGRTALFIHAKERPDILFRRYFQDRLKKDALEFWKIMP
jgi:integrase